VTHEARDETAAGNPLLAAAIEYATTYRWAVFPCRPRTKTPATRNGLKDATVDVGLIRGWWRQWPDANVAIATGKPSGLLVIDVDPDGLGAWSALCDKHAMPPTATVQTPRGGLHVYFAHDFSLGDVRNSAGRIAPGIDVRGTGGYVVAPPSFLDNDRQYAAA
jgi:hypothetical protein